MISFATTLGTCDKKRRKHHAMAREVAALLIEARRHLGVSQGQLGEMLGSSERTGQRWERGGSTPMPTQLHTLAGLVYPHARDLAAQIAAAGGSSLEHLGIVRTEEPPPPPPPAQPEVPDPVHIVDTVVCAAAEAMNLMPNEIRPALRAAFRRARLAGLTVEAVDRGLHADKGAEPAGLEKKVGKR
jgi:DNA-binding transcriptional regulator YiaG